jgi:Predicted transcriptional regulators
VATQYSGRYYYTGQLAALAAVSERTLRYYDRVHLLSPTHYSESGYRLYSEQDFTRLQYILALKFLGFSLDAIRTCLRSGPQSLPEMLALQKAMLHDKRAQIDAVIQAIEHAEQSLRVTPDCYQWEPLIQVMKVMQMEQQQEWQNKYFSSEQRAKMQELSQSAYSEEARQKLAARGPWTEADQQRADEQWSWVFSELRRLVETGADPDSPEAQHVVAVRRDLLQQFTGGDPAIAAGLKNWMQIYQALPESERPQPKRGAGIPQLSAEEQFFLTRAEEFSAQESDH